MAEQPNLDSLEVTLSTICLISLTAGGEKRGIPSASTVFPDVVSCLLVWFCVFSCGFVSCHCSCFGRLHPGAEREKLHQRDQWRDELGPRSPRP